MGLFRKASVWANTSNVDDGSCGCYDGNKKCDLVSRETSFNTTTTGDGSAFISTASSSFHSGGTVSFHSDGSDDAHAVRNKMLERELCRTDLTINRLRRMMEAGEKAQSERVALLELQLERLIELPSREYQGKVGYIKSAAVDPRLEVSALEELLTRVIAEKDRLDFENKNLKSLLTLRGDGHCASSRGVIPPSISQLDSMMNEEYKKVRQTPPRDSPMDPSNSNDASRVKSKSGDAKTAKNDSVHYKMSLHNCPEGDRSQLKYLGAYTPTRSMDPKNELWGILRAHFSCAWNMTNANGDICENENVDSGFPVSTFARHLAERCGGLSDKDEAICWCIEHVKFEIGKTRTGEEEERLRSSEKEKRRKQSKSRVAKKRMGTGHEC